MKLSNKFVETKKPEDLNQEVLGEYLSGLYGSERVNHNDPSYMDIPNQSFENSWKDFPYKKQADLLLDKVIELSGLEKFEELRPKFDKPISKGSTRDDAELVRSSLEAICYHLEKGVNINKQMFEDEVKSSTLAECIAGAGTNVQKILYAMQPSDYYQKYDYIQNIATEYANEKKLSPDRSHEVHVVNELIHEVSGLYNVVPPIDTNARYRDLDKIAPSELSAHGDFVAYLSDYFKSQAGAYSFIEFSAKEKLSRLPDVKELSDDTELPQERIINTKGIDLGCETVSSKAMKKIEQALEGAGIEAAAILTADKEGNYAYKANYQEIIEIHEAQKLLDSGVIEQKDQLIIDDKKVIEMPNGWFIYNQEENNYQKLLDTKEIKGLTIAGEDIEEYLHKNIRDSLANGKSFEDSLRDAINQRRIENEGIITNDQNNIVQDLLLVSDQGQILAKHLAPERIATMSLLEQKENGIFLSKAAKEIDLDNPEAINKQAKDGSTVLYEATIRGLEGAVEVLLAKGAIIKDIRREAAREYTVIGGEVNASDIIENDSALTFAIKKDKEPIVKILLASGKVKPSFLRDSDYMDSLTGSLLGPSSQSQKEMLSFKYDPIKYILEHNDTAEKKLAAIDNLAQHSTVRNFLYLNRQCAKEAGKLKKEIATYKAAQSAVRKEEVLERVLPREEVIKVINSKSSNKDQKIIGSADAIPPIGPNRHNKNKSSHLI